MLVGITGARGFIGENLIKRLDKEFIQYKVLTGDLLDSDAVDRFAEGCDRVVHLAGVFSNNFDQLVDVNVKGTRNAVEACKKHGVGRFIFASTGAVYGEPMKDGISHEEDPVSPNTLYGLSKAYAEEYIRFSNLNFVILRFSNVYGPGNRKGVIYQFIDSIKKQGKVTVFGTGEQKRNFLFVTDAVDAIIKALKLDKENEIFNVADTAIYSLTDLISILQEVHDLKFSVDFQSADESNQLQMLSEGVKKAEALLAWRPIVDVSDGLSMVIKDYEL